MQKNAAFNNPDKSQDWLTPAQAAAILDVNILLIYRMVESGELESNSKIYGQLITIASVKENRIKRLLESSSDMNLINEMASSSENYHELSEPENNRMLTSNLLGIQPENDNVPVKYNQSKEEWCAEINRIEE